MILGQVLAQFRNEIIGLPVEKAVKNINNEHGVLFRIEKPDGRKNALDIRFTGAYSNFCTFAYKNKTQVVNGLTITVVESVKVEKLSYDLDYDISKVFVNTIDIKAEYISREVEQHNKRIASKQKEIKDIDNYRTKLYNLLER